MDWGWIAVGRPLLGAPAQIRTLRIAAGPGLPGTAFVLFRAPSLALWPS